MYATTWVNLKNKVKKSVTRKNRVYDSIYIKQQTHTLMQIIETKSKLSIVIA